MKKETLTVKTNVIGTVTYRNADGNLHNPHGPALVCDSGRKFYYINGCELSKAEFKTWKSKVLDQRRTTIRDWVQSLAVKAIRTITKRDNRRDQVHADS